MGYNLKFLFIFILSLCLFFPRAINAAADLPFYNPDILISLDFQNASLKDILKIFSIQSGLNFIASEAVRDRTITLYFDKVPLEDAMNKLFEANNLSYELDPEANIFIVKDMGKPEVEVETRVFYLKYASVSSSHINEEIGASVAQVTTAADASTTGAGGQTTGRYGVSQDIGITTAIKKVLSKNGVVIEDYRTNSLIVQDIPSRMPIIAATIEKLDVPVPMVLIEVEVLDVKKSLVDKLGIHYGQTPVTMTLSGPQTTGFGLSDFPVPGNLLRPLTGSSKSMTPGTMNFNTAYTVYLDLLKTQTDTRFLARPSILTLNNETAEVKITTTEVTSVAQQVVQGATTTTTAVQVNTAETGITLRVTPQVNIETNEITMFVMPSVKDSSASGFTVSGQAANDTEDRTTKCLVRVKDGETVVIGGLIRRLKKETYTKIPVFGDIPILGALFRHKNLDPDADRELIVFITPHIIKDKQTEIAKAKPVSSTNLPVREQEAFSALDRQAVVSDTLSSFGKR